MKYRFSDMEKLPGYVLAAAEMERETIVLHVRAPEARRSIDLIINYIRVNGSYQRYRNEKRLLSTYADIFRCDIHG